MIDTVNGTPQGLGYALRMSFRSVVEGVVRRVAMEEIHAKPPLRASMRVKQQSKIMENVVADAAKESSE